MDASWKTCSYILLILSHLNVILASAGDRHRVHMNLLRSCLNHNCSTQRQLQDFYEHQPLDLRMLGWDCKQECRYHSMWLTVQYFLKEGSDEFAIPQFYGKWPFIRVFGVQEPASALFSIGNGVVEGYFIYKLRKNVPNTAPMYYVGLAQGGIAINAWIWSTVFHSRDLPWTEKMDYYCAYSIVMCSLMTALLRIFAVQDKQMNTKVGLVIVAVTSLFYVKHVCYLALVNFDYGYNMKVNVTTAILNFIIMVAWSLRNIQEQPYLWKAIASVVSLNLCILLEVLDFPPFWWMFDAHSLWHASTIPIVFLYASYFIDDCLFLNSPTVKLKKGV